MTRKITSKDIAKELGIAQSTVSMALRDSPEISEKTRERVKSAAKRMGFILDGVASAMKTGRNNVIGFIAPTFSLSYFAEILTAVETKCREAGFHCIVGQSHSAEEVMRDAIAFQLSQKVSGLIVCPVNSRSQPELYLELKKREMPFVFVDMEMDSVPANFVGADNVSCGYMATEHLIKLGHKRILFLQGYHDSATSWRREEGYRKALANYAVPLCPELIVQSNFRFEDGVEAIGAALERKLGFSGAVCASDNIAAGAIAELRARGIGVPSEISVIGCANLEFASLITPKLSTIDQKAQEIGRAAAETMLKLLDDEDKTRIRSVLIKPELIVRESCAAPKR